jgi:hypothetical protein
MNDKNMGLLYKFSLGISYLICFLLMIFYSVSNTGTVLDITEIKII